MISSKNYSSFYYYSNYNPNTTNNYYQSSFNTSFYSTVKMVKKRKPDRHVRFSEEFLLWSAIKENDLENCRLLIKKIDQNDVNKINQLGLTPLHQAVIENSIEMIKLLLDKMVNVNCVDDNLWTPLHCAAKMGLCEVSRYLIENGANPFALTLRKERPIDLVDLNNFRLTSLLVNSMKDAREKLNSLNSAKETIITSRQNLMENISNLVIKPSINLNDLRSDEDEKSDLSFSRIRILKRNSFDRGKEIKLKRIVETDYDYDEESDKIKPYEFLNLKHKKDNDSPDFVDQPNKIANRDCCDKYNKTNSKIDYSHKSILTKNEKFSANENDSDSNFSSSSQETENQIEKKIIDDIIEIDALESHNNNQNLPKSICDTEIEYTEISSNLNDKIMEKKPEIDNSITTHSQIDNNEQKEQEKMSDDEAKIENGDLSNKEAETKNHSQSDIQVNYSIKEPSPITILDIKNEIKTDNEKEKAIENNPEITSNNEKNSLQLQAKNKPKRKEPQYSNLNKILQNIFKSKSNDIETLIDQIEHKLDYYDIDFIQSKNFFKLFIKSYLESFLIKKLSSNEAELDKNNFESKLKIIEKFLFNLTDDKTKFDNEFNLLAAVYELIETHFHSLELLKDVFLSLHSSNLINIDSFRNWNSIDSNHDKTKVEQIISQLFYLENI